MKRRDHIQATMRNHGIVFFVMGALLLFGIWSLPHLNKDEFPQFTIRQGVIAAIYPGATAEEVEEQVTKPLERFLFTYSEINKENTRSVTEDGIVYIYADLRLEVERKDEVWSKIRAGLDLFKKTSLPAGVLQIVVVDDFGNTSSILLAVESSERTPKELETYSQQLCDRLRTIPSMGNLKILGQQQEEIAVEIDIERLSAYGINQQTLFAQLALQGFRTMGGNTTGNTNRSLMQVAIPYTSEYELAEQIIYTEPINGTAVRLKDIARIIHRYQTPTKYIQYYDSETEAACLVISIEMYPGNNIVAFGREVDKQLQETLLHFPPDLQIHRITDQPKVVNASVMSFLRDLLMSILIVIAVMLMLFPLQTALVASTGVPVCTAICLGLMYLFGIELNTVTLAALIVVLGMIVDDSVIVIDGYTELLEKGHSRWYAACVSTRQLFLPMTLATCSISGMFFPMTKIITGPLGDFVQLFPWAVAFALGASIFYAVWVIPFLSIRFIKRRTEEHYNQFEKMQSRFFTRLQNTYQHLLTTCFKHPWLTIGFAVLMIALGELLFTQLNVQMMPKAERDCFAVEIHLTEGSSLQQTAEVADSIAHILRKDERVTAVTGFIGQASPRFHAAYTPQMAKESYAQLIVNTQSNNATLALLNDYTKQYENAFANAYVRFKQIDYQAVQNPIEIYLKGDNPDSLEYVAEQLKEYMSSLEELTWVHSDYDESLPSVSIRLKADEARQLGISQTQLSLYLASISNGQTLTSIQENDYKIPVILYTEGTDSLCYNDIANLLIPTAYPGVWVPLRQVADIVPEWHHASITRRNSIRTITIGADLYGNASAPANLKTIQQYIESNIMPTLPDDVSISYGGLQATNAQVIPQIAWSVAAALLVMFILLLLHFANVSISILSLSMSLLCIFGTCLGLYIFGLDFSITAVLGMVSLIGIIVRNAIIMYEYAESLRKDKHKSAKEAAFEAGLRRMRPIFLTSATTALGVIPMIIARTGLWMPMGVVICFGTIFTLPLVVTVLPVVYWKIYDTTSPDTHSTQQQRKPKKHIAVTCIFLCLSLQLSAEPLTLDSCLHLAERNNLTLQNARIDVAKAEEVKAQAFTKYFPNVSAHTIGYHSINPLLEVGINDIDNRGVRDLLNTLYGNYGVALGLNNTISLLQHGVSVGVTALQPIYMGGQIVTGNRLAKVSIEAAQLQAQTTKRDILQEVEESYWLVVGLEAKRSTIEAVQQLLDSISCNVSTAIAAGIALPNDLLRVQLKQNETAKLSLQIDNGLQLAKRALCYSIGIPYTDTLQIADSLTAPRNLPPDNLSMNTAISNRPENRLLALNVEAEQLQRRLEIGKTLPQVAIGAGYTYSNIWLDKNSHNGTAFFTVKVPLTDWWETGHKIKQHNLQITQAQNAEQQMREKMELQTLQVLNQVTEAYQQIVIATTSVSHAAENLRLMQLNYSAGRATIADLLEAQALYAQTQNDSIDALISYRVNLQRYNRLTQEE